MSRRKEMTSQELAESLTEPQAQLVKDLAAGWPGHHPKPVSRVLTDQRRKSARALRKLGIVSWDGHEAQLTSPLGEEVALLRRNANRLKTKLLR